MAGNIMATLFFGGLIIGLGIQFYFAFIPPRGFQIEFQNERAEYQEPDPGKGQPDGNLGKHHAGVIVEHGDPVLRQELVEQTAAHVADDPEQVHHGRHGGSQQGMDGEQQGRDEEEGELERLGDPHQHGGQGGRDQQAGHLGLVLPGGSGVDGERNPHGPEDLGVAVQGEAALGEQLDQRPGALAELQHVLGPVELDAAFHRGRAEDEGAVDEVVQAGRDQDPLKEGVNPDAERAGDQHELLQGGDAHLHLGPAQQGQPGAGDHHEEGDYGDERAALEDAEKDRQLPVEQPGVQGGDDAGDGDGTYDAGVQGLDAGHHGQPALATHRLVEVDPEIVAPGHPHGIDEVVPGHEADQHGEAGAGLSLVCQTDRQADGKYQRHISKYCPATLFNNMNYLKKQSLRIGQRLSHEHGIFQHDCNAYHHTCEWKQ